MPHTANADKSDVVPSPQNSTISTPPTPATPKTPPLNLPMADYICQAITQHWQAPPLARGERERQS